MELKDIWKIEYRYNYVDDSQRNYLGFIYLSDFKGKEKTKEIIENILEQKDLSLRFKSIGDVIFYKDGFLII